MEQPYNTTSGKETVLPPMLAEFCDALDDEISVAKRTATSSAVPLTDGHKVGQQGKAHQYAFQIDSILNVPEGAPGDLMVPGHAPLNVTLVSIEGLRIVISVEYDLGRFVPTASLRTDLSFLMRRLVDRIKETAGAHNLAAARMLGHSPVSGEPDSTVFAKDLDESQTSALRSSLGRDLTVIWGPPGTGKTRTIGTIGEKLYGASRSVLIVSHTNTAVDQAIKHVARSMPEHLADGAVLRLGNVRDKELISAFPDVLVDTQVEKCSSELVNRREHLESQHQTAAEELNALQRSIAITEWASQARSFMWNAHGQVLSLDQRKQQLREDRHELADLTRKHDHLLEVHNTCMNLLQIEKKRIAEEDRQRTVRRQFNATSLEVDELNARVAEYEKRLRVLDYIEALRAERASFPALSEQRLTVGTLAARLSESKESLSEVEQALMVAQSLLREVVDMKLLKRVFKGLPSPEQQRAKVLQLTRRLNALESEFRATEFAHDQANAKLARILELDAELSRHEGIGTRLSETSILAEARQSLSLAIGKRVQMADDITEFESDLRELRDEESGLRAKVQGEVKAVYKETCAQLQRLKELEQSVTTHDNEIHIAERELAAAIEHELRRIEEWMAVELRTTELEAMLRLLTECHSVVAAKHPIDGLPALREQAQKLDDAIQNILTSVAAIDAELSQVERRVIMSASVLGATLTKTYLSDDLQSRRFDTVILDEASMAPIPALWLAALLAEKNLVIVGDFRQLPPIVQSKKKSTVKWLGRDVFEVSGLRAAWESGNPPEHFIPLFKQRRMLPDIADVANLFYDGRLLSETETRSDMIGFREWYALEWGYDTPVLLVDTGPINAWVTSVVRGGKSSRLNFLSASVTVDLAEQLLKEDRPPREENAASRILIVSPYRPHAKLVGLMIRESTRLQTEAIAGTAHSFQGSEADVVIFDLVVDEPHFRANLFVPSLDESLKGLLNVALTRAKFRLIIVADFGYCAAHGKKAFLGCRLIPFLQEKFPTVSASDVVPNGLAARAARAQIAILGGPLEADSERIVVTQRDFYRFLAGDLDNSTRRIVLYSPFMTQDRVAMLLPQLQAAAERGVAVTVITKSHQERNASELSHIRGLEAQLTAIGAVVMHKLRMHEKLVLIDDCVTWCGSLNPLSFSDTQEVMERRYSRFVMADYAKALRLDELLAVPGTDESICPICGSEIVAAEGADEPYYWRCVNDDCYTRSICEPYPYGGVLTCHKCGEPVEFGYWGGRPCWRCTANSMHRQKLSKAHLRLPRMVALIPNKDRRKVCEFLNIPSIEQYTSRQISRQMSRQQQGKLFADEP